MCGTCLVGQLLKEVMFFDGFLMLEIMSFKWETCLFVFTGICLQCVGQSLMKTIWVDFNNVLSNWFCGYSLYILMHELVHCF